MTTFVCWDLDLPAVRFTYSDVDATAKEAARAAAIVLCSHTACDSDIVMVAERQATETEPARRYCFTIYVEWEPMVDIERLPDDYERLKEAEESTSEEVEEMGGVTGMPDSETDEVERGRKMEDAARRAHNPPTSLGLDLLEPLLPVGRAVPRKPG